MHARIDHLLSLRDGLPTEAWVAGHVDECPTCAAHLRRLGNLRSGLQSLPQLDAPAESWGAIRAHMDSARAPSWQRKVRFAVAAAFLLVFGTVVVVVVRQNGLTPQDSIATERSSAPGPSPTRAAGVDELVAQSQHLDSLLQSLPERPRIERVSTAATIDTIEQRVQWLDLQLTYAHEEGLSERQAQRLWSERVELMDSLVKLRSAESGAISF